MTTNSCLNIINSSNIGIRYGFDRFLFSGKLLNIPFYIISAGLTEVISTILQKCTNISDYDNFFLFSNHMYFDDYDRLYDLDIHVTAQTKRQVLTKDQFVLKKNTLLFGDYLTDYQMLIEGEGDNLIRVGFLKPQDEQQMFKYYIQKFDIVLVGEGNYVLPDYLMRKICDLRYDLEFREKIYSNSAYREFITLIEGKQESSLTKFLYYLKQSFLQFLND